MAVQRVAVIGSGLMGRGIAHVAALGGFQTTMVDVSESILQTALNNIRSEMEKGVSLGKLSAEGLQTALRVQQQRRSREGHDPTSDKQYGTTKPLPR